MAKDKDDKNKVDAQDVGTAFAAVGGAFSGAADALFPRPEPAPAAPAAPNLLPWVVGGAAVLGAAYLLTR